MMFERDLSSGVLINTDDTYYRSIVAMRTGQKKTDEVKSEIDELRSELQQIKALLQEVLIGKNYG
jgi:hypothetical protein